MSRLLRAVVLDGASWPEEVEVIEDVDVGDLDERHVLPNMGGVAIQRGRG